MRKSFCSLLSLFFMTAWPSALLPKASLYARDVTETDVFVAGQGGYHTYRIPSLIVTPQETLLAFCEGRKEGAGDAGNIDLLLKRSSDNGASWSESIVVWDDGPNTCGNPCPVIDQTNSVIWLLLTWNAGDIHEKNIQPGYAADSRRVFVTHSKDDGKTWAEPHDITPQVKDKTWSWYATGPGAGIQILHGDHKDRLVAACDHKTPTPAGLLFQSHVIYSDDHGETWRIGGSAPRDKVNECEVVELIGGRLLLNMRNYDKSLMARQICFSDDGGETWRDQQHDRALIEPTCQASLQRYHWPENNKPGVILFSNPASTTQRQRMTVRASFDDGNTWPKSILINEQSSAYSSLARLANDRVGLLYEHAYSKIAIAHFPLSALVGKD